MDNLNLLPARDGAGVALPIGVRPPAAAPASSAEPRRAALLVDAAVHWLERRVPETPLPMSTTGWYG